MLYNKILQGKVGAKNLHFIFCYVVVYIGVILSWNEVRKKARIFQ